MPVQIGANYKLYFSTTLLTGDTDGDATSHNWTLAEKVASFSHESEATEIEYQTRENGGQTQYIAGPMQEKLTFDLVIDGDDPFFVALRDAFFNRDKIALATLDGPVDTPGSTGMVANFVITQFPKNLDVNEVAKVTITARPSTFINRTFGTGAPVGT